MSPTNQTVPEGKATNISCKVTAGVPMPTLSWSFKNKRLPPVIAVTEMENGSIIHVQNTTKYMEGTYKCTARNKANESTATSTLRVLGMLWVFICNDLSTTTTTTTTRHFICQLEKIYKEEHKLKTIWQKKNYSE